MTEIQKPACWTDEFNEPSPQALRAQLTEESVPVFDDLRALLRGYEGVEERCQWYGECWHWTLAYLLDEQVLKTPGDDWEPMALIIPAAEDVQLAMPLDPKFVATINTRRLKRGVREGLELGSPPFNTRWAVWSIPTPGLMVELAGIIKQKVAWMRSV